MDNQNLPDGWEIKRLVDLCEINIGGTPSRKVKEYFGGENVWVSIADLNNHLITNSKEHITDLGVSKSNVKLIPQGSVLLSFKLSLGKVGITGCDLYTNEAIAGLIIKNQKQLDTKYLFYVLQSIDYKRYCSGAVKGLCLNKQILNIIKIPVPPLKTQHKIVKLLEAAEEAKKKRTKADEMPNKILESAFIEMFGDPFKNKKDYLVKKVKEIVELINGRAFKSTEWSNEGLKIIRIQNLNHSKAKFNYFNGDIEDKYIVQNGDLLLSWSGTPGTSFGVFIWNRGTAVLNQHIFNVKIREKTLNKIYFQYFINAKLMELISKAHGGVGLQHITKAELNKVDVFLPPFELQQKFANLVEQVEKLKTRQQESKRQIDGLFEVLMHKAFRGELIK
jgi:type I restriction enzyme, S subunit